ncbi:MAG: hypothetical protein P4L71_21620 [Acetobacteraceae bacterium]|nr:hypothetical protein [Acetobacteraceae bacterium]
MRRSWGSARPLLVPTAVAQRIALLLQTELLELPVRQRRQVATRDALAEAILADPRVTETLQPMLAAHAVYWPETLAMLVGATIGGYGGRGSAGMRRHGWRGWQRRCWCLGSRCSSS